MKKIEATREVFLEIHTALMTGICGHAPDELSEEAKRIYKIMLECEFKFEPIIVNK